MPTTANVLAQINRAHGRDWRLITRLDGGYQGGASLIEDEAGRSVLKWSDRASWAPRVLAAKALVDSARAAGYPTPAWSAVGTTAEGFPYQVQEFVEGATSEVLDDAQFEAIVELTDMQRRIALPAAVDWTDCICRTVFEDDGGKRVTLQNSSDEAAEAVRRAIGLATPHRDADLVHTEMVHGDFSGENILMRDGEIAAVIDVEAIGRGSAGIDLLNPSRGDYLWGDGKFGARLIEETLRRDGPALVTIAAAAGLIDLLTFGLANWPADHVRGAAIGARPWIEAIESAIHD